MIPGLILLFSLSFGQDDFVFAQSTAESGKNNNVSAVQTKTVETKTALSPKTPLKILTPIQLSENDINETVKTYRTNNIAASVEAFRRRMPSPVIDPKIRAEIYEKLPATVKQLKIENSEISEQFRRVIAPVLKLYGRDKVYDIIVFRHPTPIMFSDTGVVLIISTGMIERAASDDELIGMTAHEIAHEYFAQYSIYSKHLLKMIIESGGEPALAAKQGETLALIELQCDAFAALTLSYLKYNPLSFIEAMERIGRDFPNHNVGFHPADAARRKLIEQLSAKSYLQIKMKKSQELRKLKEIIIPNE